MDIQDFYMGNCFDAYKFLGCHIEGSTAVFRTYAPEAEAVSLIGEFNDWAGTEMERTIDGKFWECKVEQVRTGMIYKYQILQKNGKRMDHCDPYGYGMELRPQNASVVRDLSLYQFYDDAWMRERNNRKEKPLNIYELHAGSWKKRGKEQNAWYNYRELADRLIPYLKETGYNYVELLPLSEHPCDESWGYQCTGFYSPTSRYGNCDDLRYFVDMCHRNEIGVILDFVPVHFAVDEYGLADYDGSPLYEYPYADIGYSEWGSKNFNHGRGEVRSFLQSNANYWLKEYHFDGLRMDAISNLIFWQGNAGRGVNYSAVEFLKNMNHGLKERNKGILLAAEDSTVYPGMTLSYEEGGFDFDYKWNMGWMHDTLEYFQTAPQYRARDYHKLTFSMQYFYSEDFILSLSHDEVVHGKATILQKMSGTYETKFSQGKCLYLYMYTHPGKKLNFMGNEFGQLREWDEKREQDWDIFQYKTHTDFARFCKDMNLIYFNHPALWECDYKKEGFSWLPFQETDCVYAFVRHASQENFLIILNLLNKENTFKIPELPASKLDLLIDTDWEIYGGTTSLEQDRTIFLQGEREVIIKPYSGRIYQLK